MSFTAKDSKTLKWRTKKCDEELNSIEDQIRKLEAQREEVRTQRNNIERLFVNPTEMTQTQIEEELGFEIEIIGGQLFENISNEKAAEDAERLINLGDLLEKAFLNTYSAETLKANDIYRHHASLCVFCGKALSEALNNTNTNATEDDE